MYNKIINLNILNSASMADYLYGKEVKDENNENEEINKYIQKSMKFYSIIIINKIKISMSFLRIVWWRDLIMLHIKLSKSDIYLI